MFFCLTTSFFTLATSLLSLLCEIVLATNWFNLFFFNVGTVSADGGPTPQQFKNLEQQNERMKQALVKLRDLTNQDKHEIAALTKQVCILHLFF